MNNLEIINRISYLRIREKMSARKLSTEIGLNEGYINRLESKKDFLPSLDTLLKIIEVCNSSTEEFFYYEISQYKIDKELIELFKSTPENKKIAVKQLLSN